MEKYKKIFRPSILIILVLFLSFSFIDFIFQANILNTEKTQEHLGDVSRLTANNFNQKFSNLKSKIKNTCELIGTSYNEKKDIGNILNNLKNDKNLFDRIWYLDENKVLNDYYDNISIHSNGDYINEIFNGNNGISDAFLSHYNQKEVIAIYAPVYRDSVVVGGVVGIIEINKESMDYIYNDVFEKSAYVYVTDSAGKIVLKISNDDTLYNGNQYFEFLKNDVSYSSSNYNEIMTNINNQTSGCFSYSPKDSNYERMIYYTPAGINNWYIFTVISNNVIEQQNNKVKNITLFLVFKITIVFLVMLYLIIRYFIKINHLNTDINEKLRTSNKKIEMILQQTSDRIFEYDMVNDSLVLDSWNDHPKIMLNHFLSNLHNYNFVLREHEQLLKDNFNLLINGENKVVFDAILPAIGKNNKTWYHISMIQLVENQKAIGTLRNSTKEMEEYNVLLQDQMFRNSVYSNALAMFSINMKNKKLVIFQKNGKYSNAFDADYDNDLVSYIASHAHKNDKEKVKKFFNYENIQNIYLGNIRRNKIEYRYFDEIKNDYIWIRFKVQFEHQSSNNEILMIAYANDINDEKNAQMEIEYKARRDGLTGLYNRQTFNQYVNDYLSLEYEYVDYCAYMIVDLDNFKDINDTLGHSLGDIAIQKTAQVLDELFNDRSYVGRYGGDEFVIFIYQQESYAVIESKAKKALELISQIEIQDDHVITASLGITFVKDEKSNKELFNKCDEALYFSKKHGKNRYSVHINK